MKRNKTKHLTQGAVIAALYVVLTLLAKLLGLDSGQIQLRFSEALCILPVFLPAAVPGLTIGCLLSNLLCGNIFWDVLFGTLATLIGAIGTRLLRKNRWLCCLPPILANTIIVPFVLVYGYGLPGALPFFMLTVGIGEVLSCGLLGQLFYRLVDKHKNQLF
ncbi:MAG: QueT transporter family protein [Clostridia bacterium]|nr:QueT transporter family protein [Clostridia bacterium]